MQVELLPDKKITQLIKSGKLDKAIHLVKVSEEKELSNLGVAIPFI